MADKQVGTSAAPSAKHKDKNSYRYNQEITHHAPLCEYYKSMAKLTVGVGGGGVQAEDSTSSSLVAEFAIKNVPVNENQWMILNLRPSGVSKEEEKEGGNDNDNDISSSDVVTPTLRIKVRLEGSYRAEVAAMIHTMNAWFQLVDNVHSSLPAMQVQWLELPKKYPLLKMFLIPAVPFSGIVVALLPVVVGILIVGLPFFLPFLVVLAGFAASVVAIIAVCYYSTEGGRQKFLEIVQPAASALVSTSVGQRMVYDTGSRPSPKTMAKAILPGKDDIMTKLFVSLAIDFIGSCSYLLPGVGEAFDLGWAPLQTILVAAMYDDSTPSLKYISFVEEILPFTDLIPSATVGWCKEYAPMFVNMGHQKVHEIIIAARKEKHVAFA